MSDTTQAQADLPNDDATVLDPLDAGNSTNGGISELAEFEQEMLTMSDEATAQDNQGELPATPETEEATTGEEYQADEQESPEEETSGQFREQMRPRLKDPLDIAVASLAKAEGISLIEASKRIEAGRQPKQSEQSAPEQEHTQVETTATVNARLMELRAEYKEATTALEFERASEIFEEIETLRDKQVELKFSEVQEKSRTEQRQAQEYDEKWDAAAQRAMTFYPDSAKPDTAMAKRIAELDREMKELGDDLYFDPEKPFILAKKAALELKIPMTNPKAKPAAKPSPVSPIQPASGNARTAPANPARRASEELDSLDSLDAYEAHVGAMSFG